LVTKKKYFSHKLSLPSNKLRPVHTDSG